MYKFAKVPFLLSSLHVPLHLPSIVDMSSRDRQKQPLESQKTKKSMFIFFVHRKKKNVHLCLRSSSCDAAKLTKLQRSKCEDAANQTKTKTKPPNSAWLARARMSHAANRTCKKSAIQISDFAPSQFYVNCAKDDGVRRNHFPVRETRIINQC